MTAIVLAFLNGPHGAATAHRNPFIRDRPPATRILGVLEGGAKESIAVSQVADGDFMHSSNMPALSPELSYAAVPITSAGFTLTRKKRKILS